MRDLNRFKMNILEGLYCNYDASCIKQKSYLNGNFLIFQLWQINRYLQFLLTCYRYQIT